jgi:hypothetical protein
MAVRDLSAEQARALATHHHDLSRSGRSVEEIATRVVGLHTTSPATPYLSLRARLPGFTRQDLDDLMWHEWRLVRLRAMRTTMFVFPADIVPMVAAATRHLAEGLTARWLRDSGLTSDEYERIAASVEAALAERPMTVRALRNVLDLPASVDVPGVVGRMCDTGVLVGGAPPRSWRSPVRRYHRWSDVLGDVDLDWRDEASAIRELIRRYVESFGPVTLSDMSWWTGMTKRRCRVALETLGDTVEEVAVADWPGPLYRIADAALDLPPMTSVAALPLLDPYVQGYRDRMRMLDPARHGHVYDGGGNAAATLVWRGRVVGVWQIVERPAPAVWYHLFAEAPPAIREGSEVELAAAGNLYFDRPVEVVEVPEMDPLGAGGGRSATHPLDGRLHRVRR